MAILIDCSSLSKGVHYCYPTRSELQGGVDLVREHPTEAFRYVTGHPRLQQRGEHAGLILSARGSWAFAPCTPYVARLAGEADSPVSTRAQEARPIPAINPRVMLTSEELSNEKPTTPRSPYSLSRVEVARIGQWPSHITNTDPLSTLLLSRADDRYRRSD